MPIAPGGGVGGNLPIAPGGGVGGTPPTPPTGGGTPPPPPGGGATHPPTTNWPVSTHIPTWAYDDACNGGSDASAALVRQWVTYAESNCGPYASKVLSDCHASGVTYCTAIEYLDANLIYTEGSVPVASSAQEDWWLHQPGYTDQAHRLAVSGYGGGNILNQANPDVDAWFQNYVRTNFDAYDGLMMDDTGGSLNAQLYGTGFTSSQELTSDSALLAAHEQMAAALTHTDGSPFLQVDNGISVNPNLATTFPLLDHPGTVKGLITEGAPEEDGRLRASIPRCSTRWPTWTTRPMTSWCCCPMTRRGRSAVAPGAGRVGTARLYARTYGRLVRPGAGQRRPGSLARGGDRAD